MRDFASSIVIARLVGVTWDLSCQSPSAAPAAAAAAAAQQSPKNDAQYAGYFIVQFHADPTSGRAYGTMCRPSVCRLSVTFCVVAKRYVVGGRRWYRWIGRW